MQVLDWISIKGFKSIAALEKLPLGRVNVVIGANGAGKSNFIEVFSFLHALKAGHLQAHVARAGGADRLLRFGAKQTPEMSIHVSFEEGRNQYAIELAATDVDGLAPVSEQVYFWNRKAHERPYSQRLASGGLEAGISDDVVSAEEPPSRSKATSIANYVRAHFERWRVYHFHDTGRTSAMKQTADIDDNGYLRADGANLAAFLHFLRERHPASYALIRRTVQRVAPFFDDFQLAPQRLNPRKIRLEWRHVGHDQYFDAASFSDGTLRFVALTTLFLQPLACRPSVILVDEPELGLHPYAVTLLASLVRQAAVDTQVILSTQSPLLLDHFEPAEVLVAEQSASGTSIERLDSARLAAWLQDYSLGQLWEKNELGGRPLPLQRGP